MIQKLEPGFYASDNFDELLPICEKYFGDNKIETLYKLRNWNEKHHPEFLTLGELYFSKPSDLNDPFDIHRPINFDVSFINEEWFFEELVKNINKDTLNLQLARTRASNQLDEIRKNPTVYFLKNYEDIVSSSWFDNSIGIFSLSTDPLNDQLWGYYGGGLKGFAIGFDPMSLTRDLQLNGRLIRYHDTFKSSDLIGGMKDHLNLYFQKNTKWVFESEFRYCTIIDNGEQRKRYFSPSTVKEIILGLRISPENKKAIIEVAQKKYPHVKIYQLKPDYLVGKIIMVEIEF